MANSTVINDAETRDLMRLATERAEQAVQSVAQLSRDPAQAYAIYQASASGLLTSTAGAFAAWQGLKKVDPIDLGFVVLTELKNAGE